MTLVLVVLIRVRRRMHPVLGRPFKTFIPDQRLHAQCALVQVDHAAGYGQDRSRDK